MTKTGKMTKTKNKKGETTSIDGDWDKALAKIRSEIEEEIRKQGVFVDNNRRGFFIASSSA